jgi:uncharacterized membrane protein YedE/YeeE
MNKHKDSLLWRYAGMVTQFLLAIAIGLFAGIKLDDWLALTFPLAVWLLPLCIIIGVIFKIVKDTSVKK